MTTPCDKGPEIAAVQQATYKQGLKISQMLDNQQTLSSTMTAALDRLTATIEADIGTRKDVEQGKKDIKRLYTKSREIAVEIRAINERNTLYDGKGVFDKFDTVWNFIQQEKGWRRFIPATMTFICAALVFWEKVLK